MAGKNYVFAERNRRHQTVDLYLVNKVRDGHELVSKTVAKVEWVPVTEAQGVEGAEFRLGEDEAQALFDDLWRAGFRPAENVAAEYRAQARHLEDMRALAFGKLGVPKP